MAETVFAPEQHAVMFGLLARGACQCFGNDADGLLKQAVEAYGMERGTRMARRCLRDGHALDMVSYDAYGELPPFAGSERTPADERCAHVRYRVVRCPWCDAWQKHGLAAYGPHYCRWVDAAILRGFNPQLRLRLPARLSDPGSDGCHFEWENAPNLPQREEHIHRLRQQLAGGQTRSFAYHTAHLLHAVIRRLHETDPQKAAQVHAQAAQEFARIFGREAWRQVEAWQGTDFSAV